MNTGVLSGNSIVLGTPYSPTATISPFRSLTRITQPAVEPVSLTAAKSQCRVDTEAEDAYIQGLISVARQYVEDILDITICTTVWEATYDLFPVWTLVLPRPPMQAQNVTVTYRNGDGSATAITSDASRFQVDARTIPGRIYPLYASTWPPVRGDENSVVVRWSAGYGDDGQNVPPVVKHLILVLVAGWFDMRQPAVVGAPTVVPYTFETLLAAANMGVYR